LRPNCAESHAWSKTIFGDALPGFDQGLAFNETNIYLLQLEIEGRTEKLEMNGRIFYKRT
jgi:hypothetical protein